MHSSPRSDVRRRMGRGRCQRRHGPRLLRRTVLIALLCVSGSMLISSVVELYFRYRDSRESLRVAQQEMAYKAALQVEQFITTVHQQLQSATHPAEMLTGGLAEAYRFELLKLLRWTPAITTAFVLDLTGREVLKVSREQLVLPEDLRDYAGEAAVLQAHAGTTFFGSVYFVRESEPYMCMAVPIVQPGDEVVGILVAEVNLTYIWDVITRIQVGQTGYAYVVSPCASS